MEAQTLIGRDASDAKYNHISPVQRRRRGEGLPIRRLESKRLLLSAGA